MTTRNPLSTRRSGPCLDFRAWSRYDVGVNSRETSNVPREVRRDPSAKVKQGTPLCTRPLRTRIAMVSRCPESDSPEIRTPRGGFSGGTPARGQNAHRNHFACFQGRRAYEDI